jgi:hypothetical protein
MDVAPRFRYASRRKPPAMSRSIPLEAVLADIEKQIDFCEEKKSFHAAQVSFHAERQGFHQEQLDGFAADLEKLRQQREAFRAAAESVREGIGRRAPGATEPRPFSLEELERFRYPSGGLRFTALVRKLVEERSPNEVFGRTEIARALHVAIGGKPPKPSLSKVSMALLRLAEEGTVKTVRKGSYGKEALYRRG